MDRVKQQFQASSPNQLGVADATYLPTREGTLYLAFIKDLFSRCLVGWSMSTRQYSELMVKNLQMAIAKRQVSGGMLHHSDSGIAVHLNPFLQGLSGREHRAIDGAVGIVMIMRWQRD